MKSPGQCDVQPLLRTTMVGTLEDRPNPSPKIVSSRPSFPKTKLKFQDDVQSKRLSQKPIIAIYFSDSIFLLSGAHLDKGLGGKSKCNYTLPQERALNTFLSYCQRSGLECKSEKMLSEAAFH